MRVLVSAIFACCIIALLLVAGCADVNVQKKVGDFGTAFGASSEEQKAIDWFTQKYGDPRTNEGLPRFLEPLITTGLTDKNMPVDKVTVFPVNGSSIYFWVIYDNFKNGDLMTITWTYMENGRVVTTVEKKAGGDFGRLIAEFQKPDSGWGKGLQKITVSGGGTSAEPVIFTIGDTLQTTALPYSSAGSTGTGLSHVTPAGPKITPDRGITGNPQLHQGDTGLLTTTLTTAVTTASAGPVLSTDINNCGAIGKVCPSGQNAKPGCYQGTCTLTCNDNFRNCGTSDKANCVAMFNDPNYCGSCGKKCGTGQYCDQTRCVDSSNPADMAVSQSKGDAGQGGGGLGPSCSSGESVCYGNCVNLKSSLNCGFCGHVCNFPEYCLTSPSTVSQYRYYCHVPGLPW